MSYLMRADGRERGAAMRSVRVLLVDDSPVFLEHASHIARECAGLELVGTAASGAEALALIAVTTPDLVLLDLNMPVMNGFEVTRRAKAADRKLRVIAISVHGSAELRRAALAAGADAFVQKDALVEGVLQCATQWFGTDWAVPHGAVAQ